ncbi:A/G-specific adenine glycosylase [Trichococcus ilyis]|uniref:Adenine DNA glycosylase n=1 Tax=Trichococcus ilyis TaxID=640938 RepID=A0A143YMQ9_9LACT|nr:A/G-specific adenine glycosylase [Trichococcus ilyis]CZQ94577.1 helix-hairpin-helix motif [Trichococcus ilyis]SEJ02691.1 A/G-specific DNA-adenine glycosylase [Trichococcus ilyis]
MTTNPEHEKIFKAAGIEMWPADKITAFRKALLDWYDKEKRDLPWRRTSDPYSIWVSEIMLQQTRVDTVIPYYHNFLDRFPDIAALAAAPEDAILKAWEGLGYYSRVKNMQKAAQQIVAEYGGVFPADPQEIAKLKGIGPYTAGAVSSIAFQIPEPAVDGNVMRVMSRLFEIDADIAKPASRKIFEAVVRELIDPERPGDFNQALMDLGSSICTPLNPQPEISPIKAFNAAYKNGTMHLYPVKTKAKRPVPMNLQGIILQNGEKQFLLEKRPSSGLLADFWTFPLIQLDLDALSGSAAAAPGPPAAIQTELLVAEDFPKLAEATTKAGKTPPAFSQIEAQLSGAVAEKYGLKPVWLKAETGSVTHVFSHIKWQITGYYGRVLTGGDSRLPEQCRWVSENDFADYAFPVPQQKMWQKFQQQTRKEFGL